MFSGAGDAGSRRRWPLYSTLLFATIIFLVFRFVWVWFVRITRGSSPRRISHKRQAPQLLVLSTVLPAVFSPWYFFSTVKSREGSLAIAAIGFSGSNPSDPLPGYRRTSLDVDSVRARQSLLEYKSQRTNSPFPSPVSRETTNSTKVAPFSFSGASLQSISRLDPNLFGSSSPSSPSFEIPSPPTCSLLIGGYVHLRRYVSGDLSCGTGLHLFEPIFKPLKTQRYG
ncbi:unnamed protein product [Eruca vesicaria subsp. sativa]|uniref:Uncharacterized protein n=1 Tax=Eruca vesicaria subsp. sativa TaxID=29727 RepID=A0ABC8LFT5_ERUVS|nr:unnamed protein product [Eruca vesicaria subsp. sativa]